MNKAGVLVAALVCAGCHNMVQQPRYDEYEPSSLFPNGMAMQAPPSGAIARDEPAREVATRRPPMSLALVQRGRERFEIYCTPCHGFDGSGNGVVPSRGFPQPPDFHSQRLKQSPVSHFYDVITNGYGVMFSYADRVEPSDRWAIAAYIRALQETGQPPRTEEPDRAR